MRPDGGAGMTRATITPAFETDFEGASGGTAGWGSTTGGGAATDTAIFYRGSQSALFNNTGAARYNQNALTSKRILACSFYWFLQTDANLAQSVLQGSNANGDLKLELRPGRKLRVNIGSNPAADSAALTLNQWYLIDILMRSDSGTYSIAWSIDGAAQTGQSVSLTAADITNVRLGNTSANTSKWNADAFVYTHTAADHPIGALSPKRAFLVRA
jgi:hypothetical protein